jgi:hypothetical protein
VQIGADLARRIGLSGSCVTTSITDLVVSALTQLGFEIRSAVKTFDEVAVQICTCPLAEIAVDSPEVVRGIQRGLMQEVIDDNVAAIGLSYAVTIRPDAQGSCEVTLRVRPSTNLTAVEKRKHG